MKRHVQLIAIAVALVIAAPAFAAPASPAREKREERREERKERREDRKEQRQDRREDRQERRDDRQDRVVPGRVAPPVVVVDRTRDDRRDRREDRREDRQERREDRRELRQDRREDRREVRQDRREDRQRAQRYQQLYQQRLLEQQRRWVSYRYHDSYHNAPLNHRYRVDGRYWRTNRYGMDLVREAANLGYAEGMRAGQADRYDNWRFDYRDSWAYRDGTYGYNGRYVNRAHYQHYFREGFRRGYEDGYYGRSQYGRHDNGQYFMIAAILAAILGT